MEWGHCVWNENEMRTTSIQTKTYMHVGMTPSYTGKIISDFLRQFVCVFSYSVVMVVLLL